MAEIAAKKEAEESKRLEKIKKKEEAEAKKRAEANKTMVAPDQLFRTAEYTAWDANGIPTVDKNGEEIKKSQSKKLAKLMEVHKKKYEKWQALQS